MTEQFGKILLVGRPRRAPSTKRVRIAAFGPLYGISNDFSIRVYCIPETGISLQNVLAQEENTGILLTQLDDFLLKEKGALCICLEDISTGLAIKPKAQYLVKFFDLSHSLKNLTDIINYNDGYSLRKKFLYLI